MAAAEAGVEDGQADGAPWVLGLLGQGGRGLEADEGQDGVDGPGDHPREAAEAVDVGEAGAEHRQGVGVAGLEDQGDGQGREHQDLEQAENGAGAGAEADPEPAEHEHGHGGRQGRHDPPGVVAPAELLVEGAGDHVAEDEEQQGRHQRLHERIAPADQEADGRVQPAGGVGVEAAGRGQAPGQLPDRDGHQQAADQGEEHRQGQGPGGEVGPDDDREGDRRRRGHVGDGLEQHLPEADGLPGQTRGRTVLRHGAPPSADQRLRATPP